MDKTFNDLMDIVNRTKKIDGNDRPKPKSRPVVREIDEDYEPREYDVVDTPKRTRTVKKTSPKLFDKETIDKALGKKTTKKSSTKKTTTTKKASTAKKTTTKKTPAKSESSAAKKTTPKVSKPKISKEDILSEIKVELQNTKNKAAKKETATSTNLDDPKNAQLYAALQNSLFSGGTDISEYMEMENSAEAQKSLQELRAKREAQKINAEITKEQQEYEQLFTGSLGSVFQNNPEETIEEEQESADNNEVDVNKKNAELASELNAIRANLENKKNGVVATEKTPVKPENKHDATYELDTGNKDLDKKIAEYYKRKQEKINAYKAQEEGLIEPEEKSSNEEEPIDYEAIFGGSMMTRDQLLGIESEPETEDIAIETTQAQEDLVEDTSVGQEDFDSTNVEEQASQTEEDENVLPTYETLIQDSDDNEVMDNAESESVEQDLDETSVEEVTEEIETQDTDNETEEETDSDQANEESVQESKENHIKSLLSDLLFSKKKAEESAEKLANAEPEVIEEQESEISGTEEVEDEESNNEQSEEDYRRDYESVWNGGMTEEQSEDDEDLRLSSEVDDVEEDDDRELSEEELDGLSLNFGGMRTSVENKEPVADANNSVNEDNDSAQEDNISLSEPEVEEYEVEENTNDDSNGEFVLVDTPQIFGDFDDDNKQEVTPYIDRIPVEVEDKIDQEDIEEDGSIIEERNPINESFVDEENLGIKAEQTSEDIYDLSSEDADLSDYILTSNTPQDESETMQNEVEMEESDVDDQIEETYDEQFENLVNAERMYERTNYSTRNSAVNNDQEDNTYVVETLPENKYDILGNHVYADDESSKDTVSDVIEDKNDSISKEEFYNEMARLQENLINQLKGNAVQTESKDFFAEKEVVDSKPELDADSVVEELLEKFAQYNINEDSQEEPETSEETMAESIEDVNVAETTNYMDNTECKAEPVDPEHFDDYNLLNKQEPLNDDDLAFQEKSEEEKPTEKDAYFYLSPEDNEKKANVVDEYVTLFDNEPTSQKEVGDINIFKNIGNATPSSEILKEVNSDNEETSSAIATEKDDEVEAIFTLMGIERKPITKTKEDMKVLYVASECQPFVASGGLGDVAGSLPKAIAKKGRVDIRVILPLYGNIKQDYRDKFEYLGNFTVHLSWRQEYCGLFRYYKDGVTYYFIDNERYFKREKLYGYFDDGERFAYFSRAVVEALPHLNFFPDIIHCNDWQSSLVSVYIKTENWSDFRYYKIKNIYTIHNVEYQGVYGMYNLKDLFGIDFRFRNDMDYNGDINLTKAAIQYSDKFTTVSNSYCENLKQPYCSRGLHHIIIRNEYKLSGIINGIDYDFYNPATDTALFKNYDFACMDEKVLNKKSWQDEMGLPVDGDTPMIAIVSRLVNHKGLDLVIKVIENILQQDIQLVVVGTGDEKYVDYFKSLESKYPTKVRALVDEYSNINARKAYAASDIFLMPSKIEPCGISQMIASRYGSVPIVREVGGLKDTIKDFGCVEGGNGYTFTNYNPNDLSYQLNRAIRDYQDKTGWREKMKTCMSVDFTWNKPAEEYIKLYRSLCD